MSLFTIVFSISFSSLFSPLPLKNRFNRPAPQTILYIIPIFLAGAERSSTWTTFLQRAWHEPHGDEPQIQRVLKDQQWRTASCPRIIVSTKEELMNRQTLNRKLVISSYCDKLSIHLTPEKKFCLLR